MNEKPLVSKEYSISMEMFGNAFTDFQKKFTYPKNILMSCAFALIGISYIPPFIRDPGNSLCIMIIVICIFLTAGIWFNTFLIRKNLMNSIQGIQGDKYAVDVFERKISICTTEFSGNPEDLLSENDESQTEETGTEKSEAEEDDFFAETEPVTPAGVVKTVIDFAEDNVKVLEKKDYYIVYIVKRMFYVIPKNIFSEDEIKTVNESFKKANKFIEERK